MLLLVPVKVRNSIDTTSISEITKTTVMTTASTSLKLPFTDVVDRSLGTDRATAVPLSNGEKTAGVENRFPEES